MTVVELDRCSPPIQGSLALEPAYDADPVRQLIDGLACMDGWQDLGKAGGGAGGAVPAPAPRLARVAFVDDDADLLAGLRRNLRGKDLDWEIGFHSDSKRALEALLHDPVDVAVIDIRMPEMNGVVLAGTLAQRCPQTVTIMLSGSTDFDLAVSSINVGRIFRYLMKPCPTADVIAAVKAALRSRSPAASPDEQLSAKAAIDLLKCGVVVLGQRGEVVFTNQRAGQLLARRDGVLVENTGICRASSTEDTRRLHAAIATARDQGQTAALSLQTARHGPLRVTVRPQDGDGSTHGTLVCLYLFSQDDEPGVDPALLRGMFGLTASESRLAAALADGLSLEEAAAGAGWSLHSAKTYLKTVFSKVGVSRQAELVSVILNNVGR